MNDNIRVVDFFCGAGGFSEGFRQQGFNIIMGVDNWRPAVETHNINHNLDDEPIDILDFEHDWVSIDKRIPDSEIIVGSPPCVDFSMSNRAGKSYKGLGIRLIETYLRIVVIKKLKQKSILKSWLMENVPNSRNFVQNSYSLKDLNLIEWAFSENLVIDPDEPVIQVKNNGDIFNAADFGSAQGRKRFICGEIVANGRFPFPKQTHNKEGTNGYKQYVWLSDIKRKMPSPIETNLKRRLTDPNYSNLKVKATNLTDHFYDSGAYKVEWEKARFLKKNHPYMGKMQFPEGEERTSRTVMATRSVSTREALIYKSEYNRKGDGEYRIPTIREIACLMGFPYTYQFSGREGNKWRQIGNAVCPHMSASLAKEINLSVFNISPFPEKSIDFTDLEGNHNLVENLNTFSKSKFNNPPKKNKGAKFRRQPFKIGNMTVALINHNPNNLSDPKTNGLKWFATLYEGAGKSYDIHIINDKYIEVIDQKLKEADSMPDFQKDFYEFILSKVPNAVTLQHLYEKNDYSNSNFLHPIELIDTIKEIIEKYDLKKETINKVFLNGVKKELFAKRQLMAMWTIGKVVNKINNQ